MEETGSDDLSDFNDDKKRKNNIEKTNKLNKNKRRIPKILIKKNGMLKKKKTTPKLNSTKSS